ncbi:MAG TPA: cysteine--tRNA ligase [Acidimicrobiia bacterium]|nr:cysteine--tRNA ligase [Acidimicrobiia bacterium]
MQVHSTLHRRSVELVPRHPGEISIYVCGATVQSEPHLGHGRYAVVFDVIRRYLTWGGHQVTYVRNVTDIDDKIIVAAAAAGESVEARAERMASIFAEAYERLGVLLPDIEPKATEHLPEMLELIEHLIDRGLAYPVESGDVYFAVRAFEGYGKLSGRKIDELLAGARVEVSDLKHDPLDFALWKAAKPGEPSWDSPWGPGRPGWHIECSAMSARYLGEGFDIHGGGSDLIFPHHENELAQSEGASGQTFARYWLHNGMVNLGGEKMSKSTGRLIELAEAIDRFGGMTLRLFYLRSHYRSPIEFSEELLAAAGAGYQRLYRFIRRTIEIDGIPDPEVMERFRTAMDDDFATPEALAVLYEAVTEANRLLDQNEPAGGLVAAGREIMEVLGIRADAQNLDGLAIPLEELAESFDLPFGTSEELIGALLAARADARAGRDFTRSDLIRDGLAAIGVVVEDTADGARWHRR